MMYRLSYLFLFPILLLVANLSFGNNSSQNSLYISEIINAGEYIILSDDSTWQVAPPDITKAATWILPTNILIKKSENPQYPYKLVNSVTQESIYVKKSSREAISSPPQQIPPIHK